MATPNVEIQGMTYTYFSEDECSSFQITTFDIIKFTEKEKDSFTFNINVRDHAGKESFFRSGEYDTYESAKEQAKIVLGVFMDIDADLVDVHIP